jgi:glycosyltransferase involved in cell wall biosynthesis
MDNPLVVVLMSTYNGERFLRDQIESVLNQVGVNVS